MPPEKKSPRIYRRPLSRRDSIGKDIPERESAPSTASAYAEAYLSRESTALTPTADKEIQVSSSRILM